MSDTIKYLLDESRIPKVWYNLAADLPKPLPPVLHPGTQKPLGPDDLAPLFPMELMSSQGPTEWSIPMKSSPVSRGWRVVLMRCAIN